LKQAKDSLYTDFGNETLRYLKSVVLPLREQEPPTDYRDLRLKTWRTAAQILQKGPGFQELLRLLPSWETPTVELMKDEEIKAKIEELTKRLADDVRIRSKTTDYLKSRSKPNEKPAKTTTEEKENAPPDEAADPAKTKQKEAEDPAKAERKDTYRIMFQAVRAAVLEELGRRGNPFPGSHFEPGEIKDSEGLRETVGWLVRQLLEEDTDFQKLLEDIPKSGRNPKRKSGDFQQKLDEVVKHLSGDLRLRNLVEQYAADQGKGPDEYKDLRGEEYKELYRAMGQLVRETMRETKGYEKQQQQDMAMMAILQLFRCCSQDRNQANAQRDLRLNKYRGLSKMAKKELQKRREQEGDWGLGD
jgi:hypothetical protein